MGIDNGLAGDFDRVERALVARMTHIHDHPQLIHTLNHVNPEVAQPRLGSLGASVSHPVSPVESELDLTQAKTVKQIEILEIATDAGTVLNVGKDTQLALRLGSTDIGERPNQHHPVREARYQLSNLSQFFDRAVKCNLGLHLAQRRPNDSDSRLLNDGEAGVWQGGLRLESGQVVHHDARPEYFVETRK